MKRRSFRPALIMIALLAIAILPCSVLAAKTVPVTDAAFDWELSNAKVVSAGKTVTTPQGTLTQNYVVEAKAKAVSGAAPIKNGTFRVTLSAFSPAADMPGQKAGTWYVQGKWSITDDNATAAQKKARHSAAIMRGDVAAETDFNPCTTAGTISATVNLPMSPNGGQWAKGKGTFMGNEKFEGTIAIDAGVWPVVSAAGR